MRFVVAKKDLEEALQVVGQTVGNSGSGSEISNHYLFRIREIDDQKRVEVLSSNGRIFSSAVLNCQIEDETFNSFTVEAKRLKGKQGWLTAVSDSALTFERQDDIVVATSPRGSIKFQSLDPESFPFWDKTLENVKSVTHIGPSRLIKVFKYVKNLISEDESRKPHLCVTEVREGSYYATNMNVATMVSVPGLENSTMRIHGEDVKAVVGYLNTISEGDVEILEHDRVVVFRDGNKSMFGETRFNVKFPNLNIAKYDTDQYSWSIPKQEIVDGIKFLIPCTDLKGYPHVYFSSGDENTVTLSMMSTSGEKISLPLPCKDLSEKPYSDGEFCVNYPELLDILEFHEEGDVILGVNKREAGKKGGWIRLTRTDEHTGEYYLTVITWVV